LGSKDPWTLLHHINTTEYLNYENGKFSKSRGCGVFGDDAMNIGIPSDVWRYYLLCSRPETADSVFLWQDFATRNNTELLGNLGNFINRALVFISSSFDGKVPKEPKDLDDLDKKLLKDVDLKMIDYLRLLDDVKIRDALRVVMTISDDANKYLQDTKPWDLLKAGQKEKGAKVIFIACNLVYLLAIIIEPYLPGASKVICNQINKPLSKDPLASYSSKNLLKYIESGHTINTPVPLFRRIEKEEVDAFREKYRGRQNQQPDFPLNLKVGLIEQVENHPAGGDLFILQINVGEEKNRQVVSRLKKYTLEEIKGKHIVVLCNVRPTLFHQVNSEGIVLIAVEGRGNKETNGLLTVDEAPGVQVVPDGAKFVEKKHFDYKKEFAKLELSTDDNKVPIFQQLKFKAKNSLVYAEKITKKAKIQ